MFNNLWFESYVYRLQWTDPAIYKEFLVMRVFLSLKFDLCPVAPFTNVD